MARRPRDLVAAEGRFRRQESVEPWYDGSVARAGWQSNGGGTRGHAARALPFSLDVDWQAPEGRLAQFSLVGVFACCADRSVEAPGTHGATVQLLDVRGEVLYRHDLVCGRHYDDARLLEPHTRVGGDGTWIETLGTVSVDGVPHRLDRLTFSVPEGCGGVARLRFKDLGSAASFVVYDVRLEYQPTEGCPFHPQTGGVALGELPAILRVGDRLRFGQAVKQLEQGVLAMTDLDEARSQALTFLAMVAAACLEAGGDRSLHREALEAARELDQAPDIPSALAAALGRIERIATTLFPAHDARTARLMESALAAIERSFAKDITDAQVAAELGLSTSHFRFLFRQTTGQPFHKYLIALRLEKARRMLSEQGLSVSEVAAAVGFSGLSHFSRAFTQRFQVNPNQVKRTG